MSALVSFILNGENFTYGGNPSARLLDVLRTELGLMGTKCGCKEGECGACAVIINGRLVNSCLVAVGSLGGSDVLTIEGFCKTEMFSVLEEAYASVSAVQCGFCIPGMMMASGALLSVNPSPSEEEIRTAISGNLCRCTGYNAIVKAISIAAKQVAASGGAALSDAASSTAVPSGAVLSSAVLSDAPAVTAPGSLKEALLLLKETERTPLSGGTDLMVSGSCDKQDYLFINNIPEMHHIISDEKYIRFGAACKFTDVIENPLTPTILREACLQVAAPAIRNAGSLGGNIANGSAKADSALIFMVTDSVLRLVSADGERLLPVKEFYLGGGKTALAPAELIVEILMPRYGIDNFYYKKVGARNALAIARTSFVGILDVANGVIQHCAVAFGAVIDVVIRHPEIDEMLLGKTIEEARGVKETYLAAYDEIIKPRPGRVGVEYRKDICMNLLRDFLESNDI